MQNWPIIAVFILSLLALAPKLLSAQMQTPWEGVPEPYRNLPIGRLEIPDDLGKWGEKRLEMRRVILESLGEMPPRPDPLSVTTLSKADGPGYTVEKFEFHNGVDSNVSGYLVIPSGLDRPAPAILAMHGHFPTSKESILASILGMEPSDHDVAMQLVKKGYVIMAIDAYAHGERIGTGPAGDLERMQSRDRAYWDQESTLFKLNLLLGRTLWGMMLRDQQIALDYLCSRPEVDPERIGATGKSMGSLCSWWLGAIDERVKAVVAVACSPRYEDLIAIRGLRLHGIYYYVPGILKHFDTEGIMGLLAPRPFLILVGDQDAGAVPGIETLRSKLSQIYALYSSEDRFNSIVYPDTGHVYLPEMKDEMIAWFDRYLAGIR